MKEILDKISSYNLFNYLLPGILFVCISKKITTYDLIQDNELLGAFLYYFIGMVISRVGSLMIEPFLKWSKFIKFTPYRDFVLASRKDEKINLFSEVNNTYRTIIAMFLILLAVKGYNYLENAWGISDKFTSTFLLVSLLIIFVFSYRKQIKYISKRIDASK